MSLGDLSHDTENVKPGQDAQEELRLQQQLNLQGLLSLLRKLESLVFQEKRNMRKNTCMNNLKNPEENISGGLGGPPLGC